MKNCNKFIAAVLVCALVVSFFGTSTSAVIESTTDYEFGHTNCTCPEHTQFDTTAAPTTTTGPILNDQQQEVANGIGDGIKTISKLFAEIIENIRAVFDAVFLIFDNLPWYK